MARGFVVRRVRVPLAKLPGHASGYGIVQITDVHVGPTIGRGFVEAIVARTNALVPDLVVITGDLVDGSVAELRELVAPLAGLRAKDGVFFVTGNHEYYSGADAWIAHLETLGIRVLRNERVDVRDAFELAGVDDASSAACCRTMARTFPGPPRGETVPDRSCSSRISPKRSSRRSRRAWTSTFRSRTWRASGPVQLARPPRSAVRKRASSRGRHLDIRQPGDRLLGPAMRVGTSSELSEESSCVSGTGTAAV